MQRLVVGGVADHEGESGAGEALLVDVDHDDRVARTAHEFGQRPAHATAAADDDMVGVLLDVAFHATPSVLVSESAFQQCFQHRGQGVQRGTGSNDDQRNCEELLGRSEGVDLAEADGRDRGDGLVDRIEKPEPEEQEPDRADDRHPDQGRDGEADSSPVVHAGIVPHEQGPVRFQRGRSLSAILAGS